MKGGRRVDRAARRPIRRLLCSALLLVGVAGCNQTKMGTASGTIELTGARGGPTSYVALGLDYPVEVTAGRPCVVKFSFANQSDVAADIVRIRFDFDTAGDPYFHGFAIEGTTPSGGNPAGYGDFVAADYGALPPHATKEVTISLRAVRPGGYGATVRVGLIDQGQLLALYSQPIHTVIR